MALKIFGEFEIEHLMAQALFEVDRLKTFLNSMGITKEMRGNKIALYSNPDQVAQILEGPHGLIDALNAGGHGPVRHEGGDNDEGGKQAGKNEFLRDRVNLIRALSELPPDNANYLPPQAAKLAVFNLFAWIKDVAQGKVTHNGQVLGVMGGAAFADTLDAAYDSHPNTLTPEELRANPNEPRPEYDRKIAATEAFAQAMASSYNSTDVSNQKIRVERLKELAASVGWVVPRPSRGFTHRPAMFRQIYRPAPHLTIPARPCRAGYRGEWRNTANQRRE